MTSTNQKCSGEEKDVQRTVILRSLMTMLLLLTFSVGHARSAEPLILITNDDGIEAPELQALAKAASAHGDVIVIAPRSDSGGSSSSIRGTDAMRWGKAELESIAQAYWIEATPAVTVRWGIERAEALFGKRPDLVLSGINPGPNLGASFLYSGTVGAAREAAAVGVPAIAISNWRGEGSDLPGAADVSLVIAMRYLRSSVRSDYVNLNLPRGPLTAAIPVTITRPHPAPASIRFEPVSQDPAVVKAVLSLDRTNVAPGSDLAALLAGQISFTPMEMEEFDEAAAETLRQVFGETGADER